MPLSILRFTCAAKSTKEKTDILKRNFSELLSWKAVRRSEYTLKLAIKRSWREFGNDQHFSLEANVSRLPFITQSFWVYYFSSNHMSSQGAIYLRRQPWHYNDLLYQTISCAIKATYYAKTTWIPWKTKRSTVDSYGIKHCVKLLHCHMYAMSTYFLCKINHISLSAAKVMES